MESPGLWQKLEDRVNAISISIVVYSYTIWLDSAHRTLLHCSALVDRMIDDDGEGKPSHDI